MSSALARITRGGNPLHAGTDALDKFTEREESMCMTKIRNVRQAVDALGGTGKTARFLKVVPSAVSNMLAAGEIPRSYHWMFEQALEELGYAIDYASLFGVDRDDLIAHLHDSLGHERLPAAAQ